MTRLLPVLAVAFWCSAGCGAEPELPVTPLAEAWLGGSYEPDPLAYGGDSLTYSLTLAETAGSRVDGRLVIMGDTIAYEGRDYPVVVTGNLARKADGTLKDMLLEFTDYDNQRCNAFGGFDSVNVWQAEFRCGRTFTDTVAMSPFRHGLVKVHVQDDTWLDPVDAEGVGVRYCERRGDTIFVATCKVAGYTNGEGKATVPVPEGDW